MHFILWTMSAILVCRLSSGSLNVNFAEAADRFDPGEGDGELLLLGDIPSLAKISRNFRGDLGTERNPSSVPLFNSGSSGITD